VDDYFAERVEEDRRRRQRRFILGVFLAGALTGALFFYFRRSPAPVEEAPPVLDSTAATAVPLEPTPLPTEEPTPAPTLPPMAEEKLDDAVRRLVAALSSHPALVKWLATEGLVRRFVAAVDNIAEGKSPRKHLLFLDPRDDLEVSGAGERIVIDPRSFKRYDTIAAALGSFDVDGAAEAFEELEPRLDEAYRELGYPDRRFRDTLGRAIGSLLRVPLPRGEIAVRPKLKSYRFADERLEARSAAEKHLLRMGRKNMETVQAKLAAFAAKLDLPRI